MTADQSEKVACAECDGWLHIEADGKWVTEAELLHLPHAPRSIERRIVHKVWCPSEDHRMSLIGSYEPPEA